MYVLSGGASGEGAADGSGGRSGAGGEEAGREGAGREGAGREEAGRESVLKKRACNDASRGEHAVRCFGFAPEARVTLVDPPASAPRASRPDRAQGEVLLKVDHIRVRFPVRSGLLQRVTRHVNAVDDVSFELRQGETLALVGESGSGKTTTGKAILQLLRGSALVDGSAKLGGIDLMQADEAALKTARRDIQIIFQDPFGSLNPRMRVGEILAEGMVALKPEFKHAERTRRIAGLLDHVGLPAGALTKYPHEF
jgi:peptide/nickel transport system ATP-binding protein